MAAAATAYAAIPTISQNADRIATEMKNERTRMQQILVGKQRTEDQHNADIRDARSRLLGEIQALELYLQRPNLTPAQVQTTAQRLLRARDDLNQLDADSQHLFRVIKREIKGLILQLKAAAEDPANRLNLNQVVKNTVERLETMGEDVDQYAALRARTQEMSRRGKLVIQNIQTAEVQNFINEPAKDTDDGVLSAVGKKIDLITLDTLPTANRLETEEEANFATENQIKTRLANCQYLEILYLTKHDELMKIFQLTLGLYEKYTYAIKILLFVLKNLLEQRPCPPPGPGQPPGQPPGPGQPPQIKLPKALISDIKQLLKDQKHVQDVITRMGRIVNQTVPSLVTEGVANAVSGPTIGSTIDDRNPPQP